jgi:glycosyltransferase involved in cell wall biosynthesis
MKRIAYAFDWCVMMFSSAFVIPTKRYIPYLGRWAKGRKSIFVIPNTCHDYSSQIQETEPVLSPQREGIIRLAYMGYLDVTRGSKWLMDFCSNKDNKTELIVAGDCRDSDLLESLRSTPNIVYLPRQPYIMALSLMKSVHAVTIFYDPAVPVNRVLDPTKFYESMMVGTPVLVSKNMSLDPEISREHLGFVVEHGDMDELRKTVDKLRDPKVMKSLRSECRAYYLKNLQLQEKIDQYRTFYENILR